MANYTFDDKLRAWVWDLMREESPYNDTLQNQEFLQGTLQDMVTNGIPTATRNEYTQTAARDINKNLDRTRTSARENLAQGGMLKSGMGAIMDYNLASSGADAMADVENNLNTMDMNYKDSAISKLLGLDQLGLSKANSEAAYTLGKANTIENQRQFDSNFQFQKDSQPSWWESILGMGVGAGSRIGSAAILAG